MADARLHSGESQIIERERRQPGRRFTTAHAIAAEQEILRRVREGQNQMSPVMAQAEAFKVVNSYPQLNRAQKEVVEDVLS